MTTLGYIAIAIAVTVVLWLPYAHLMDAIKAEAIITNSKIDVAQRLTQARLEVLTKMLQQHAEYTIDMDAAKFLASQETGNE